MISVTVYQPPVIDWLVDHQADKAGTDGENIGFWGSKKNDPDLASDKPAWLWKIIIFNG